MVSDLASAAVLVPQMRALIEGKSMISVALYAAAHMEIIILASHLLYIVDSRDPRKKN